MLKYFKNTKRVVIKLGTSVVMKNNSFNQGLIKSLAGEISSFRRLGKEFIVVTSGAIGLGLEKLNLNNGQLSLEMQQASAAVGQSHLMSNYEKVFSKFNQPVAQILLTQGNFYNKTAFTNLKNTIDTLLRLNVVPIINENDSISTDELAFPKQFSDNDSLAALVAKHLNASLVIICTDVNGLYTSNPKNNKSAQFIPEVKFEELLNLNILADGKSLLGRGGFSSKFESIKLICSSNIPAIVLNHKKDMLSNIFSGKKIGTFFHPANWHENTI